MAIEVIRDFSVLNEKSDVWSFGLVMWEMFSKGNDPFPRIPDNAINADTVSAEIYQMRTNISEKPYYATPGM